MSNESYVKSSLKLSGIESDLNTAAQAAYLELLISMPPMRRYSAAGQQLIAQLRNAIARCTGHDPQEIQDYFENKAHEQRS